MAETLDKVFEGIHKAKERRLSWYMVAADAAEIADPKAWRSRYPSKEVMWATIEESTGYGRNLLQRYVTTFRALAEIEQKHRSELQDVLGSKPRSAGCLAARIGPFAPAEVATRAYKLDAAEGLALIRRMLVGKLSTSRVREEYKDLLNRQPEGKVVSFKSVGDARRELDQKVAALEGSAAVLYGNEDVRFYYRRYRFSLVNIDVTALTWQGLGLSFVDGFVVLHGIPPKAEDDYQELLSKVDYRASFFRHLWLYIANPEKWSLERISQDLNRLGLLTVGIASYEETGEVKVLRRPRGGDKPQRYQTVVEEVMRQGIPDFAAE
ncbi:hypothetical protein N825_20750 [Skermanella stibiiresistens SB22]|uniref:Uncharacterized protein n=1 Tax=Skermanella stibiiresistens SB22 TaxID=1385369 RepID=W9H0N5_9PROT|nr:hypothetical protein [Skermanella stibiiresistens]EWY37313.1 hypothetical protein N825_20750 [Skermanella stibiiresistens SB22]